MMVYAITDTKKGRTGIAPTYLQTTLDQFHRIAGWYGGMYAALQSYSLGSLLNAVILFFTITFTSYFLLFLSFSLYYATYSVNAFFNDG